MIYSVELHPDGRKYELELDENEKVSELKRQIAEKLNLREVGEKLICAGRVLAEDKSLVQNHVKKDDLIVVLRLETLEIQPKKATGEHPGPCSGHAVVRINENELLCFGGGAVGKYHNGVYILNLATSTWRKVETKGIIEVQGRTEHSMCKYGNKVYVYGGRALQHWFDHVLSLDLDTMEWKEEQTYGRPPRKRSLQASVLVGERWYIHGGYGQNYMMNGDFYILNLNSMTWVEVKPTIETPPTSQSDSPTNAAIHVPPPPLAGHTMVQVQNKIYLYGGVSHNAFPNDMYEYDTDRNTWTKITKFKGAPPAARSRHSCVAFGTKLVICCGMAASGQMLGDFVIFDTVTRAYKKPHVVVGQITPRNSQTVTRIDASTMLVLGGDDGKNIFSLEDLIYYHAALQAAPAPQPAAESCEK
eukprot:GEZU01021805.1.p1 GENE.GEZU01021805.1~~GEZU01021805.1.p1  ORF type:complete len:416 (+),score=104.51 GEZU01021805.1:713-1960(+)